MPSSCVEAAAFRGLGLAQVQAVIVVGRADEAVWEEITRTFPAVAHIVTLEPQEGADETPFAGGRRGQTFVASVRLDPQAEAASVYAALARVCSGQRASLRATVVLHTAWARQHEAALATTWQAGIDDLLIRRAARFAAALDELSPAVSPSFVLGWADTLLADGDPFHALRLYAAVDAAGIVPEPAMAMRAMKAWCACEQPVIALQWLERSGIPLPQRDEIARDLRAVASEQRQAQQDCWAANAAFLQRRFPALADALAEVEPASASLVWLLDEPWQLHAARREAPVARGEYPLLVQVHDGRIDAINLPEPLEGLCRDLRGSTDVMGRHAVIGDAVHLEALRSVLGNPISSNVPGRTQVVYGLIPDLAMFRRFAEVQDLRGVLDPARIELFWGPDAEDQLVEVFRRHRQRPIPRVLRSTSAGLATRLDQVLDERRADYAALIPRIETYDDPRLPARTLEKLERGEPLSLWMWSSRHTTVLQFVAEDLKAGFESLGHHFELLIEDDARDLIDKRALYASLASSRPDVLLFLDHFRPQFRELLPVHTPTIAWLLDELPALRDSSMVAHLGPSDLCLTWNPQFAASLEPHGYPALGVLPFGASAVRYDVEGLGPGGDDPSIAFITHLSMPADEPFAPGFVDAVEAAIATRETLPSGNVEIGVVVDDVAAGMGLTLSRDGRERLCCVANAVSRMSDRLRVARAIRDAGLSLACYGRGWEDRPEFADVARGVVAPGMSLRDVYRRHKVVLHINVRCNMHPRVLEAMLCGGFVLARSDAHVDYAEGGIAEHFDLERELCLFTDLDDLAEKAARACSDEPWRRAWIEAGRDRVLRSHTMRRRAQQMLEGLHELLRHHRQRAA